MSLWKCIFRSVLNIVAARQSKRNCHLQDCGTIALSLRVRAPLLLSQGEQVRYTQLSFVIDTSLCQRCEVVVFLSGIPTASQSSRVVADEQGR
jgi:hypothetical protein